MEILELKVVKHGVDEGLKSLVDIQRAIDYINKTPAVINVNSSGIQAVKNLSVGFNDATKAASNLAKEVVVSVDGSLKKSIAVVNDGIGRTRQITVELGKETDTVTETVTLDYDKMAKAAERTAERRVSSAEREANAVEREQARERAAIEQTERASTSLGTQFNNLVRNVQNISKQYPAGTFDSVSEGIERAQSSLGILNQLWADGEITSAEYQVGVRNLRNVYDGLSGDTSRLRAETQKLDKVTESLWTNIQKFARWYIIGNVFTKVISSFREALSVMKDVDSELANIQKVTDRTDAEMQKLAKSAYSVASSYGVAATDYLQSVSTFAKAGYDDMSESLAELATKTQLVGDVTSDVANQFLISIDAAWKMNGNISALSKTLDAANTIENNYATSIQKLAEGMPIVASTAAQAGMSVEETMAALGTITSVTQESGTKAATALRALLLNLIGAAGEYEDGIEVTEESIKSLNDVLNVYAADAMKAAEAAGTVINPMTAIAALAEASEKGALNQAELFEMLSSLGGKLRTNQLTALVTNFETFNEQLEMAEKNAGSADAELEVMLGTWNAKTKILKNTWTEFISNTVDSGLIKWFLDATIAVVDFGDNLGITLIAATGLFAAFNGKKIVDTIGSLKSLKDALKGVAGGMTAVTSWFGLALTAISAVVMIIKQHKENLREAAAESLKLAEETNTATGSIYDAYTAFQTAKAGTEEFDSAAQKLAETLGTTIPENAESAAEALRNLTREELNAAANSANVALDDARRGLVANRDGAFVSGLDAISPELAQNVYAALNGYGDNQNYFKASKSADDIKNFYEQLQKAKTAIEEYARTSKNDIVLQSSAYREITDAIDSMTESYNTYVSAIEESNLAEARIVVADFAEQVGTVTPAALAAFGASINANAEYTDDFKSVVLEVTRESFPQFAEAAKGASEVLDTDSESVSALESKLKAFSENVSATDKAIGGVVEALDKFGVGSYEVYEAMLALEEAIPGSTSQLYDFETGALKVDAALLGDKASLLDLIKTNNQVNLSNTISELERLRDASIQAMAATMAAVPTELQGAAQELTNLSAMAYNVRIENAKKAITELNALFDNLGSRSSYTPKSASTSGSSKTEDPVKKSHENTIKLLKSELEIMEKQGASEDERIAKMKAIQDALHEEAEYLRSIRADQVEINSLSSEWLDYQDKIKKITEETLETQKELFDSLRENVDNYYDKVVTDKEKELDLEEKILAVQEAQAALAKAESERNVRYYNAAAGQWEWAANAKNVKSAQDALDKAKQALTEYNTTQAQAEFKSAWEYVADQIKDGAMTFKEAYDYMYAEMKKIQDKYGVNLGLVLEDSIGGFKDINGGIGELSEAVSESLIGTVGLMMKHLEDLKSATDDLKTAWGEAAEKVKSGELPIDSAFAYLKEKAQEIADKYGIDMTEALDGAIAGFDKTSGSIDDLWKQVIITLMRANSVNWYSADEVGKEYLHAQNQILGKAIGATYEPGSGYWVDEKGYRIYDPKDGSASESAPAVSTSSESGSSSDKSEDTGRNNAIIARMQENAEKWWTVDEDTKAKLAAQNESLGKMIGAVKDANGVWWDKDGYRLFDSGGILSGIGGIKATSEDEMILPPDITKQLLSPISDRFVANRLDMMRQCLGVESSKTAGAYSDYSVGTQHNGDIYNMNGYSITEKQAKSMSVYDFARLAKGLGISNNRN